MKMRRMTRMKMTTRMMTIRMRRMMKMGMKSMMMVIAVSFGFVLSNTLVGPTFKHFVVIAWKSDRHKHSVHP